MADQEQEDPNEGGIFDSDHPALRKYHIKKKGSKMYVIGPGANEDDESGWTALPVKEIERQIQSKLRGYFNDPEKNPILKMKNNLLGEIKNSDRITEETKELYRCLESSIRSQERELRRMGVIPKIPQRTVSCQIDMPVLPQEVIPEEYKRFMEMKARGNRANLQPGSSVAPHQPPVDTAPQQRKIAGNPNPALKKEIVLVDLVDSDEETAPTKSVGNSSGSANQLARPTQFLPIPPAPLIKIEKLVLNNKDKKSYEVSLSWNVLNPENRRFEKIAKFELVGYRKGDFQAFDHSLMKSLGVVNALALPMICTLQNVELHSAFYIAVRAIDEQGRYSPYSNHLKATVPGS